MDLDTLNRMSTGTLPGHLGIVVTALLDQALHAELSVQPHLMAPNGFLHAGTILTLADTSAGYGCLAHLPPGAQSFTTLEIKSNHLATARDGRLQCIARAVHLGRSTQLWDATVSHVESGKTLALFRCTQMLLYPQATARQAG